MLRFIFPAMLCVAMCCPMVANAQGCGCGAAPAAAMDMSYATVPTEASIAAPMDMSFAAPIDSAMAAPIAAPMASGCGCAAPAPSCGCAPKPRTRKKLQRICAETQITKLKRVCTTDACGCPKSKLVRTCETVKHNKLQLVDVPVDPCKQRGGRLRGALNRLKSMGNNGCCPAPVPSCGCN